MVSMSNIDARSLDHKTLEALRIRAVRSVQAGESPSAVARALGVTARTMYGWLARYRRSGWGGLKAKPLFGRPAKLNARAAMDLQHGDAEEPVAAQILVRVVDTRDGGRADQTEVQHHAGRQFRWPVIGADGHYLPEAIAPGDRTR